jgi:hypothetical protein
MKKRVQMKFTFETDMAAGLPPGDLVAYVRQRLTDRPNLRPRITVTEINTLPNGYRELLDHIRQTGETD